MYFIQLVLAGLVVIQSLEGVSPPSRKAVPATQVFVPSGYDDNDEVVIVVEGYLTSTCQQIRSAKVSPLGNAFEVTPMTESHGTICDPLRTAYTLNVILNPDRPLEEGDYEVHVLGTKGKVLKEPLHIDHAVGPGVDNALYAPIDNVEVGMLSGGKMRAVIEGRFQNTCRAVRVLLSTKNGKTYELRPEVLKLTQDRNGAPCAEKEWRFNAYADFDEPLPGRYLMHVRSQNGRALNQVFSNIW
jgi:hypothetical protein